MRKWLILWLVAVAGSAGAQMLPAVVAMDAPMLLLQGDGTMRWFGLKVYDIRLWTQARKFTHAEPFALELIYDMNLSGKDIANKSVELIREQGQKDEAKLKRWGEAMARVFPDIKKGDALIGVSIPGKEARFYSRERFIASVPDPEFAKAFFDIWLAETTTEPRVRARLLGDAGK
ncbi:MAG: chalcone isomerase family protein [Betaproteobacteria bacterium]|nr:chalcone isomerase family protein [Betaproteobacteria bacterium]